MPMGVPPGFYIQSPVVARWIELRFKTFPWGKGDRREAVVDEGRSPLLSLFAESLLPISLIRHGSRRATFPQGQCHQLKISNL